jgi:polysaccharide export outer membrane protein
MKKPYFYIVSILLLTISCIPSKKVRYLQTDENALKNSYLAFYEEYKLKSGDNLYINVSSLNNETQMALLGGNQIIQTQGLAAKYKDVYLIDIQGNITLPEIGKITAKNLTIKEINDTLIYKLSRFYNQVTVQVRLADGFITILGEVNRPGRYQLEFEDKMSIYDLLGLAGDLKKQANRNTVKIIRNIDNENKIFTIDLTKVEVLENENFYLQPNDVVYIEPLRAVFWQQDSFPFMSTVSVVLATVTSLLVIFTYINK